jgi:hypothetical protein
LLVSVTFWKSIAEEMKEAKCLGNDPCFDKTFSDAPADAIVRAAELLDGSLPNFKHLLIAKPCSANCHSCPHN